MKGRSLWPYPALHSQKIPKHEGLIFSHLISSVPLDFMYKWGSDWNLRIFSSLIYTIKLICKDLVRLLVWTGKISVRRDKKLNMVLVLWLLKMRARVRETFFLLQIFHQLKNIDLSLKDRDFFFATSYYI